MEPFRRSGNTETTPNGRTISPLKGILMKTRLLACLTLLAFGYHNADAGILGFHELKIDFTKAEDAKKKATWDDKAKLDITERGLGWDGETNGLRSGWVQTEPLAIGLSWRPMQSANVNLKIPPDAKPFKTSEWPGIEARVRPGVRSPQSGRQALVQLAGDGSIPQERRRPLQLLGPRRHSTQATNRVRPPLSSRVSNARRALDLR